MKLIRSIMLLVYILCFSGCISTKVPVLNFDHNAEINSLSTAISISMHSAERNMSGSGFMVFRKPGDIHIILLSPFGTTLFEVYALGDQLTLLYPSQGVAYTGHSDHLPRRGGVHGWHLLRWVMDLKLPDYAKQNGSVERLSFNGQQEKITYEHGLIIAKTNSTGDEVFYGKYSLINGVPLAQEIDIRNKADERILLKLEDPDVNAALDNMAFKPKIDGFKLLPLSALELL
jgi:hypothetical protein